MTKSHTKKKKTVMTSKQFKKAYDDEKDHIRVIQWLLDHDYRSLALALKKLNQKRLTNESRK